jgi:hypothetical protein
MRIADFITQNGILITSTLLKDNKDGFLWEVTLTYSTQTHTTSYRCGRAFQQKYSSLQHKWVEATYPEILANEQQKSFGEPVRHRLRPTPPDSVNVLSCLHTDAYTIIDCPIWEDWAENMGMNVDSIKDRKVFKACCKTHLALRKFFGVKWADFLSCEPE